MRLCIFSIIIFGCLMIPSGCIKQDSETHNASLPDTLNVAVELSTLTLSTSGDTISGFSFEVLQDIMEQHSIPVKVFMFNNIEEAISSDKAGDFHIFVSNIPVTTLLKNSFIATEPLYTDRQVLVQNIERTSADSLITSIEQLHNRPVWVPQRSAIIERIYNLVAETGNNIIVIPVENLTEEQMVIMVSLGEIPRVVASESTAAALKEVYPHIDFDTRLSFNQFRSWFLNPADSTLRDSVNLWLESYKTTDRFKRLAGKYHINVL